MKLAMWRVAAAGLIVGALATGCGWNASDLFADGGGGDFLVTGRTLSHFEAVQVDPRSEDSAGPLFVKSADLDGDGRLDLVTAWAQSQPVQIHLQRVGDDGEVAFQTTTLAGNIPVTMTADLAVADLDGDDRPDVILMAKSRNLDDAAQATLDGAIIVFFGPEDAAALTDPLQWQEVLLTTTALTGAGSLDPTDPETGGYTAMDVGDVDLDGDPDIVAALNSEAEEDEEEASGRVELFSNPGVARARRGGEWARFRHTGTGELSLEVRQSTVKDVMLLDVDRDGDLDVVLTRPDAASLNVRWLSNPVIRFEGFPAEWATNTIGQVATSADALASGDLDGDGITDVIVRSNAGRVIQWFRGPRTPSISRNVPWQVYTLAEFRERTPQGMTVADVDLDGRPEVIIAAEGGIAYFEPGDSAFEQWRERLVVDDLAGEGNPDAPPTTDPLVEPSDVAGATLTRSIHAADLDGDGAVDFIATLDRSGLSGLTNDALVWFRSTLNP
ncbi:MAG: hypothetical protein BroJett003_15260 [Planctomycetota bacterium]|nr:MAG: hypothetical protein BroJett003_15260 [Planctomycetota bacterium]